MFLAADILGLGHSLSSFGVTLALVITFFIGLGGLANLLIGYVVLTAMAERRQNQARIDAYDRGQRSA